MLGRVAKAYVMESLRLILNAFKKVKDNRRVRKQRKQAGTDGIGDSHRSASGRLNF